MPQASVRFISSRMLEHHSDTLVEKRIFVSGFGNMALGACRQAAELGAKVITLSGPGGYIYDADGITTNEKFDFMMQMRASGVDKVQPYTERFGVPLFASK